MFAYYSVYEPRTSQSFYPRSGNFYQPAQHPCPCSYYHNNTSPFHNFYSPHNYFFVYDDGEEQLLREQEERERLKRFYERKAREQRAQSEASANHQPKRSFKVKIQEGDNEEKSTINKSQAAYKIFNFIKNQTSNKQTRKILHKLHILHIIENELKGIQQTKYTGNLTFKEENENQILLISIENKRFLEYEDKVVKLLDKLDRVQSEGADIIRERRKLLVKFAQNLLGELDNEKEKQWKRWKELSENSDVVMPDKIDESNVASITDVVDKVESDVAPIIEEINAPTPSSVDDNQDSEPIKNFLQEQESQSENIETGEEIIISN